MRSNSAAGSESSTALPALPRSRPSGARSAPRWAIFANAIAWLPPPCSSGAGSAAGREDHGALHRRLERLERVLDEPPPPGALLGGRERGIAGHVQDTRPADDTVAADALRDCVEGGEQRGWDAGTLERLCHR